MLLLPMALLDGGNVVVDSGTYTFLLLLVCSVEKRSEQPGTENGNKFTFQSDQANLMCCATIMNCIRVNMVHPGM